MTREEEIKSKAIEKSAEYRFGQLYSYNNDVYSGFIQGAQWADKNPQSSWISVKDDLPCNHKELLLDDTYTKDVLVVMMDNFEPSRRYIVMTNMHNKIGPAYTGYRWKTEIYYTVTHWMPIPEPPKN